MARAVKQNETFDPTQIRVLGTNAVMLHPNLIAHLIQQTGLDSHVHSNVEDEPER